KLLSIQERFFHNRHAVEVAYSTIQKLFRDNNLLFEDKKELPVSMQPSVIEKESIDERRGKEYGSRVKKQMI
ncbi:hypothetical protein, partial [Fangia hongkongensis]